MMIWTMVTRQKIRQRLSILLPTMYIGLSFIGQQTRTTHALVQHPQPPQHKSSSSSSSNNRQDFLNQVVSIRTAVVTTSVIGNGDGSSIRTGNLASPAGATKSVAAAVVATPLLIPKPPQLPPIGLGCWAWGDSLFWGPSNDKQLKDVFDYVVSTTTSSSSSVLLDTVEVYASGKSKKLIG